MIDIAAACNAVAVPCNPTLPAGEMRDLFSRVRPDAVFLPAWQEPPDWLESCRDGITVFEVDKAESLLGEALILRCFRERTQLEPGPERAVSSDDPALIIQTSGTEGQPKLVPVSHRNLLAMAARMEHLFELSPLDRCASLLPLYYAQGIKSACFVPLLLGGSVALPAAPVLDHFEDWVSELRPTWFPAGPTFLQALLDRLRGNSARPLSHGLRFIVSGSASLPEQVRSGLRSALGVPILEAYGFTETGLITGNSVRPNESRDGTVGLAFPGEVAVAGGATTGEVLLRGPSVLTSYLGDDADANRSAFVDGWFRTGDLGSIDADGFLTITGRIKEIINRGGEKVSPYVVERAILQNPCVREAAAFSVPHPRLGEDVAAAVVLTGPPCGGLSLTPGATSTSQGLQTFLRTLLPDQMIPRSIFFMTALPKGHTGKVLRRTLTETWSASASSTRDISAPETEIEIRLTALWRRLLNRCDIGVEYDFFEAGGDSLLAAQMLLEAEKTTGRLLRNTVLPVPATIRALAQTISESVPPTAVPQKAEALVARIGGAESAPPFFFFHGDYRFGGRYAFKLAELLGEELGFYVLNNQDVSGHRKVPAIEEMASHYLPAVLAAQPTGALRLGGHCNGGLMAMELARQLSNAGREVEVVVLIEPISLNARPVFRWAKKFLDKFPQPASGVLRADVMFLLWRAFRWFCERLGFNSPSEDDPSTWALESKQLRTIYQRIMASYVPPRLAARIVCLTAAGSSRAVEFDWKPWRRLSRSVTARITPGDHLSCLTTHVEGLAQNLRETLSSQAAAVVE